MGRVIEKGYRCPASEVEIIGVHIRFTMSLIDSGMCCKLPCGDKVKEWVE